MSETNATGWHDRRGYWALGLGLATLLLHTILALRYPTPGAFRKYALAAEHYLSGILPTERLMDFSPFYFHLSLAAERLLPQPEAAISWLQIGLAAASVVLAFQLLARRVSIGLAAAAAAVMAVDPHLLVYARILEPEVFLLFALLAFLRVLDARPIRAAWFAGTLAALCLATRPTFLPAFLLVPFLYRLRGDRGRRWWRRSMAFLAPVVAILLALALRAYAVTGNPRTPVMNPGTVFFEGNNPVSQGTSAIYPPAVLAQVRHSGEVPDAAHQYYRDVARADAGRELSINEVNAYWSRRAMHFIRAEPGRFLNLLGSKLKNALHGFRWHDVPLASRIDQRLGFIPAMPFALLSALALAGALFEVRRWRESLLYYALGLCQLSVMLIFYVSARQRVVLFPALLYFAAVAVERLWQNGRKSWPWWTLILLLALSLSLPDDVMLDESYRRRAAPETEQRLQEIREKSRKQPLAWHSELAVEAVASAPWWLDWLLPAYFPRDQGSLEERVARLLAERGPSSSPAAFDLATVHLAADQLSAARRLLEPLAEQGREVYRGARQSSQPLMLLGRIAALTGDREAGVELLERARARAPGDPFVLAELIALTDDPAYQEPLTSYWSQLDGQFLLGRALLVHGRPRDAVGALGFVVRRMPEFRDARVLLAAALGQSGQLEQGAHQYLAATRIRLEPLLASRQIVDLFRRWAAEDPDRTEVQLFAVQVLHQHGHFAEALEKLESLDPPAQLAEAIAQERDKLLRALAQSTPPEPRAPPVATAEESR